MPTHSQNIPDGQCWRPPDVGWIKINTNGAISNEARKGEGGGVAQSHLAFMGSWSKPFDRVTDPLIIEALSLREGVIFAQLWGFSHVVMEVDCLEVVNLWSWRNNARSIVAPILGEIGVKSLSFILFSIRHVVRDINNSTDLYAKHACSLSVSEYWLEECTSFLVSSLHADCNRTLLKQ